MRETCVVVAGMLAFLAAGDAAAAPPRGRPGPRIENPTGGYIIWQDYKIEVNQYGGLGRDWPHETVWAQYELLKKRAEANPVPPNVIRAILLVCPKTEATAYRKENGKEVEVGKKTTAMTSAEVKWALEQWRQWEEMVYVYSGGNAWQRTDIKVIDEPLKVHADENFGFWSGPKTELLDKYLPFERGDYDSYNSIYNGKDLRPGPWGGTYGADIGPRGCGSSDNTWLSRGDDLDARHGFVFWHEWLNQMCWATSHIMPYPDGLWNLYVFHTNGVRDDPDNAWPWITSHRDVMRFQIRPAMWRRWTVTDPYVSLPIDSWTVYGPLEAGRARELSGQSAINGHQMHMKLGRYDQFDLSKATVVASDAEGADGPTVGSGVYYFRTHVASLTRQDVRLWAGADEHFELWLNGVKVRDGWGTLRSQDRGRLLEKVTYTTLEAGVNTLVCVVPNLDAESADLVEFRVRVCKTDGSGELPDGVQCAPAGVGGELVPLKALVVHDFKHPTFHKWADVGDDPWLLMPRVDEAALRDLTGIETLTIKTDGPVREGEGGNEYIPCQHLWLRVPQEAVSSPWIAEPAESNSQLNNDLDYNWESVGWLRVPGRSDPEKDLLLLRHDVAEPVMHLLKTKGRPGNESIVGWLLQDNKLAYVVLVNLDVEEAPATELGLLNSQPQ